MRGLALWILLTVVASALPLAHRASAVVVHVTNTNPKQKVAISWKTTEFGTFKDAGATETGFSFSVEIPPGAYYQHVYLKMQNNREAGTFEQRFELRLSKRMEPEIEIAVYAPGDYSLDQLGLVEGAGFSGRSSEQFIAGALLIPILEKEKGSKGVLRRAALLAHRGAYYLAARHMLAYNDVLFDPFAAYLREAELGKIKWEQENSASMIIEEFFELRQMVKKQPCDDSLAMLGYFETLWDTEPRMFELRQVSESGFNGVKEMVERKCPAETQPDG